MGTTPVTTPVSSYGIRLLKLLAIQGELSNSEMLKILELKNRWHLRDMYVSPCLEAGLIERTIPEKPTSRLQKYRLTDKGRALLDQLEKRGKGSKDR